MDSVGQLCVATEGAAIWGRASRSHSPTSSQCSKKYCEHKLLNPRPLIWKEVGGTSPMFGLQRVV